MRGINWQDLSEKWAAQRLEVSAPDPFGGPWRQVALGRDGSLESPIGDQETPRLLGGMGPPRARCTLGQGELQTRQPYWGQHLWARGYWVASSGNVTAEVWG